MARKTADYEADKQKLKEFLTGFTTQDEQGRKQFKYAEQLTAIAHREQVRELWMIYIEISLTKDINQLESKSYEEVH